MKRYVRSAKINRIGRDLRPNYEAVDALIDVIEENFPNTTKFDGVSLDIDETFEADDREFRINISISDGSTLVTPKGYTIQVNGDQVQVLNPSTIQTSLGECSAQEVNFRCNSLLTWIFVDESLKDGDFGLRWGTSPRTIDSLYDLIDSKLEEWAAQADQRLEVEANDILWSQQKKAKQSSKMSGPFTAKNLSKIISTYKKNTSEEVVVKGNYMRVTSYEDDFVEYFDIPAMIKELNADGATLEDVADDPGIILDYGSLGSAGIHHASDEDYYDEFKLEMDSKYGFDES